MTRAFHSSLVAALTMLSWSTVAGAQSPQPAANAQSTSSTGQASDEMRPATTTFLGDTGIWYVPTAEILGNGTWSVGGGRRGTNDVQGLSNVADFAGTGALGIGKQGDRPLLRGSGEENPEHANIHEEARRLNRRVAPVVRVES